MIFGKKKETSEPRENEPVGPANLTDMILVTGSETDQSSLVAACGRSFGGPARLVHPDKLNPADFRAAKHVVAIFQTGEVLNKLLEIITPLRAATASGYPTLIIATHPEKLRGLGAWLSAAAETEKLQGIRLMVASHEGEIPTQLLSRRSPVKEPSIIRMPSSTEVECTTFKNFFAISDELRYIVKLMKELAENSITRVYILGAPGAGKTTLAYYYYLRRAKGNFVAVNLTAESTGDKESMKSLICGHVPGALPGANSREGSLSFAGEGVCFLDESHGVTGVVMQVLMEVLDSGQYLPYGATKKRALECAVIFASNRSWEALREMMNMDEHARLGATIIKLVDLAAREEDLIAVLATAIDSFSRKCTTWKPPEGITTEAWKKYKQCRWKGNTRTLIRVTETACVSFATAGSPGGLIDEEFVQEGIELWEPETHSRDGMYVSFRPDEAKTTAEEISPLSTSRIQAQ